MNPWKESLLNVYYHATYPYRAVRNRQRALQGKAPVMVLFYHRIADDHANSWTASNAMFRRQILWLKRHFELVSLAEAQHRIRTGRNERPTITITFDDGYQENCQQAIPLLIEHKIPCTYFVATSHVIEGRPFPHDVAAGRPLAPNTPEEIREMALGGIEIGAHTRTHADLGRETNPDRLHDELIVARQELQAMTGTAVRHFAFPYGQKSNLSGAAFRIARQAGYDGVCSAYGGFNFPGDDAFHLQRIHVDDDLIRLKNWVTVDPRKLRGNQRYEYQQQAGYQVTEDVAKRQGAQPVELVGAEH